MSFTIVNELLRFFSFFAVDITGDDTNTTLALTHYIYISSCRYKITSDEPELVAIVFTTTGSNTKLLYKHEIRWVNLAMTDERRKNDAIIHAQRQHLASNFLMPALEWSIQEKKKLRSNKQE